jgi:hypothetical protein
MIGGLTRVLEVLAFGAIVLAPACGGPRFDGQMYQDRELAFRVPPVPDGWRRLDADGPLLAFRDERASSTVAIGGRCHKDGDDVPLTALTHHLFINFTERRVVEQEEFELDGRAALHTGMLAKLDGVEKRVDVVVLKKNHCVYDFFHVAPTGEDAESRERFRAFVGGFATVRP